MPSQFQSLGSDGDGLHLTTKEREQGAPGDGGKSKSEKPNCLGAVAATYRLRELLHWHCRRMVGEAEEHHSYCHERHTKNRVSIHLGTICRGLPAREAPAGQGLCRKSAETYRVTLRPSRWSPTKRQRHCRPRSPHASLPPPSRRTRSTGRRLCMT